MPYPALDESGFFTLPGELKTYWGATLTGEIPAQFWAYGNSASTNNPLRPDKTRAMAPFSKWGNRLSLDGNIKVRSNYSDSEWFEYSGPCPPLSFDPNDDNTFIVWAGGADQAALNAFSSWGEKKVAYSNALQQSGQTARMVGDLAKGMADGLDNLMDKHSAKKYGKRVMRNWKKLPGWYLQYLYGWKPLADDLENIVDQLSESIQLNDSLHVILKGRWKGRAEKEYLMAAGGLGTGWVMRYILTLEQRNQAQYRYDIPNSGLENVQPLGFFGNLWEGSPYSFVIDWLAPIGQWLTALDANALAPYFLEGCQSEYIKTIAIRKEVMATSAESSSGSGLGAITGVLPYKFSRVLSGPYTITVGIPIRKPLSLDHAAQGLALLAQKLKSWY